MNSVLYSVFISLSVRMTVITLFVLLIKTVFKSKLSSKMHCLIWLIPCIQLIFCIGGIHIQTGASLYNIVPGPAVQTISAQAEAAAPASFDPRNIAVHVWLAGITISAVWYLAVFFIYRSKVSKYPITEDESIIKSAESIRRALGIPQQEKITLRLGDTAQTMPHLIILPRGYTDEEIHQILLHELCHYRRRDYAKLWAALAALCINWFNPVIWFSFKLFRADLEMMCDDKVLKLTDNKKQYAKTLVKSAMMKNRFIPGAASVHNGKNEVKTRVKRIASLKKFKPVWAFAAACLCVTISCLCLTDAVSVAVENTTEITKTPAPVSILPDTDPQTEKPVSAAETSNSNNDGDDDSYVPENNNSVSKPYYAPESDSYYEPEAKPISEPEPQAEAVTADEPVSEADTDESAPTVNDLAESSQDTGNKETYELDDGRTVVLQYDGADVENGYIIN